MLETPKAILSHEGVWDDHIIHLYYQYDKSVAYKILIIKTV